MALLCSITGLDTFLLFHKINLSRLLGLGGNGTSKFIDSPLFLIVYCACFALDNKLL